jgi:hypothetical protein
VRYRIVSYQRGTSRQQQEKDGTMNYQIKNHAGDAIAMAIDPATAHIIAQALRERDREHDYTVHPV